MNALMALGAPSAFALPQPSLPPAQNAAAAAYHAHDPHQHALSALADRHIMSNGEVGARLGNNVYLHGALSTLLQKPAASYTDVVAALMKAAGDGTMTHAQALQMASKLPSDTVGLRAALEHFRQVTFHATGLLRGEQSRRSGQPA